MLLPVLFAGQTSCRLCIASLPASLASSSNLLPCPFLLVCLQAAEAIESLQQELEQSVSGWLQSGPSAIPRELAKSLQALLGQLLEKCQLEIQNQQRFAAASGALPTVSIAVGAGRPPTTPAPAPGRKPGGEGSPRRSPRRLPSPRRLLCPSPVQLQSHRLAADVGHC